MVAYFGITFVEISVVVLNHNFKCIYALTQKFYFHEFIYKYSCIND